VSSSQRLSGDFEVFFTLAEAFRSSCKLILQFHNILRSFLNKITLKLL